MPNVHKPDETNASKDTGIRGLSHNRELSRFQRIGVILKTAREEQSLSQRELADKTRILPRFVVAMEEGDFNQLPGLIFVKGFIKSVCRELQIDSEALLEELAGALEEEAENLRSTSVTSISPRAQKDRHHNISENEASATVPVLLRESKRVLTLPYKMSRHLSVRNDFNSNHRLAITNALLTKGIFGPEGIVSMVKDFGMVRFSRSASVYFLAALVIIGGLIAYKIRGGSKLVTKEPSVQVSSSKTEIMQPPVSRPLENHENSVNSLQTIDPVLAPLSPVSADHQLSEVRSTSTTPDAAVKADSKSTVSTVTTATTPTTAKPALKQDLLPSARLTFEVTEPVTIRYSCDNKAYTSQIYDVKSHVINFADQCDVIVFNTAAVVLKLNDHVISEKTPDSRMRKFTVRNRSSNSAKM